MTISSSVSARMSAMHSSWSCVLVTVFASLCVARLVCSGYQLRKAVCRGPGTMTVLGSVSMSMTARSRRRPTMAARCETTCASLQALCLTPSALSMSSWNPEVRSTALKK